jgi:hypothetical protein
MGDIPLRQWLETKDATFCSVVLVRWWRAVEDRSIEEREPVVVAFVCALTPIRRARDDQVDAVWRKRMDEIVRIAL